MIGATGVLPISNGATCRLYANNRFPGFAECYPQASIVNPAPGMWAQEKMTRGYQFNNLIEPPKKEHWNDEDVINQTLQYIDTIKEPFAVLGITVTSHVPFTYGAEHVKFNIEGMPQIMSAYLNCLSYTDSCVGTLINSILNNDLPFIIKEEGSNLKISFFKFLPFKTIFSPNFSKYLYNHIDILNLNKIL